MSKRVGHGVVIAVVGLCTLSHAGVLWAQDEPPSLEPPVVAGDGIVTGKVDPSAAPITIFDISVDPQQSLGNSISMDVYGHFAASVDPPLVEGHSIIAVDTKGRSSPAQIVLPVSPPASGEP